MSAALFEHIEYLTLPGRNDLYREALKSVVCEGDHVADLGCGVGVLGFFCLEAGAAKVWGIDHSDAIHLARDAAERAGYGERYSCIGKSTFQTDLPSPVDLVICDHVGFFGFDYGIIKMLSDANERLLKPGGKVMPQSLDIMMAAVSSEACRDLAGIWSSTIVPEQFHWLDEQNRNSVHPYRYSPDELISGEKRIGHVSFCEEAPEGFSFQTTLEIDRPGRVDGFAGWFDCHLGGEIRMTNSPLSDASIERQQAFLPVARPFTVKAGDTIPISLRFLRDGTMITWSYHAPGDVKAQTLSTWKSTIFRPEDRLRRSTDSMRLSEEGAAIAFILSEVERGQSRPEIEESVLSQFPDLFPTKSAIRDFVQKTLLLICAY